MRLFRRLRLLPFARARPRQLSPPLTPQLPREMRFEMDRPSKPQPEQTVLRGSCWVIDGDTILIDKMPIRLAGIDAPELDHPWGQQAKWAMVKLCKGQIVTARIKPEMSYDRVVAECYLPDGRDLAAELVKAGLALDWPKFSGGKYRHLEPQDARRRLWRAQLRQRGMPHPQNADVVATAARRSTHAPFQRPSAMSHPARYQPPVRIKLARRWGRWSIAGLVAVVTAYLLIAGNANRSAHQVSTPGAASVALLRVTASVLNVREKPSASSAIVGRLELGETFLPTQISGSWIGIEMGDGGTGWLYRDHLTPAWD